MSMDRLTLATIVASWFVLETRINRTPTGENGRIVLTTADRREIRELLIEAHVELLRLLKVGRADNIDEALDRLQQLRQCLFDPYDWNHSAAKSATILAQSALRSPEGPKIVTCVLLEGEWVQAEARKGETIATFVGTLPKLAYKTPKWIPVWTPCPASPIEPIAYDPQPEPGEEEGEAREGTSEVVQPDT